MTPVAALGVGGDSEKLLQRDRLWSRRVIDPAVAGSREAVLIRELVQVPHGAAGTAVI